MHKDQLAFKPCDRCVDLAIEARDLAAIFASSLATAASRPPFVASWGGTVSRTA
jgi:hypothetical protein